MKKRNELDEKASLICSKQRMQVNQFSNNEKIIIPMFGNDHTLFLAYESTLFIHYFKNQYQPHI